MVSPKSLNVKELKERHDKKKGITMIEEEMFVNVIFSGDLLEGIAFNNCQFYNCNFLEMNFDNVTFRFTEFSSTLFRNCEIVESCFEHVNFKASIFEECKIKPFSIYDCDLNNAKFAKCELRDCFIVDCNFGASNFSQTEGLHSQTTILENKFEKTDEGYICYKIFDLYHTPPETWDIEEGSIITEVVNQTRSVACAAGIHVGDRAWMKHTTETRDTKEIWKCLIKFEWLADVCVPFSNEGKIRVGKLKILERVDPNDL